MVKGKIFRFVGTGDTTYCCPDANVAALMTNPGENLHQLQLHEPIDVQMLFTTSHPKHIHSRLITTTPFNATS